MMMINLTQLKSDSKLNNSTPLASVKVFLH
jgi:hypothetical protein